MDYIVTITLIFVQITFHSVDNRISPRCECLTYTKTYGKEAGTFNSPDYPSPYPASIDCLLYTFVADTNEIVEITFKDFNVYKIPTQRCIENDYVKIYAHVESGKINEHTPSDNVLCGKYSDIPHTLFSSVPAFVLQFHAANRSSNCCSGFIGTFRFHDKRTFETDGRQMSTMHCDQQFESSNYNRHGRFYSPRYPASYPRSSRCSYRFKARPDERIKLVFEDLSFQKGDDSCINREDVVKVYDGYSSSAPIIYLLCNEMAGMEIFSTGPSLYVEFVSNDHWPGQGFKAFYWFQYANDRLNFDQIQADFRRNMRTNFHNFQRSGPHSNKFTTGRLLSYPLTRSSCDSYIRSTESTSTNGSLTSPLYPKPYPESSRCLYVFQAKGKQRIRIVFEDINLYYNNKEPKVCSATDSLSVYDKIDDHIDKIITLCGRDTVLPIMSSGPILIIEFIGFYSSTFNAGFKLSYSFVDDFAVNSVAKQLSILPCAFQFNSTDDHHGHDHDDDNSIIGKKASLPSPLPANTFTSPNFYGFYPRNTECHYFFYARENEKIKIDFIYFDVEGISPCDEHSESDYVEFSNYMAHDNTYGRYCGNLSAFHVESSRNFFRITFRSNHVLDGTGFRAVYQFVNYTSSSNRQIITNTNFARAKKPRHTFVVFLFVVYTCTYAYCT